MLQPTGLVVTSMFLLSQSGTYGGPIQGAQQVSVCDQCGGLFVQPGPLMPGPVHTHG